MVLHRGRRQWQARCYRLAVVDNIPTKKISKIILALYVEVHSRLVSWWLTNAWRSEQLARATWQLADSEQIIPAAACARSLIETAAAFWVDTRNVSELWRSIKIEAAEDAPTVECTGNGSRSRSGV
jgi:hypothetical protein